MFLDVYIMHRHNLDITFCLFTVLIRLHIADSACPGGFATHNYYRNKCYWVNPNVSVSSYPDAVAHCSTKGATLASVYNNVIHAFLQTYFSSLNLSSLVYFGLNESSIWQNGLPLEWTVWKPSEPNTAGNKDCNFYSGAQTWSWRKHQCDRPGNVVCETTDIEVGMYDHSTTASIVRCNTFVNPGCDKWNKKHTEIDYTTRVALVDGTTLKRGRIEIYSNGIWGSACSFRAPNITDLAGVCTILGEIVGGIMSCNDTTVQGTGPVLAQDLMCDNGTTTLDSCVLQETNVTCPHAKDMCIMCEIPVPETTALTSTSDYCEIFCNSTEVLETSTTAGTSVTTTTGIPEPEVVYSKKNSAKYSTQTRYDPRPSAAAVGSFGAAIIVGVFVLAFLADLTTLGIHIKLLKRNICNKRTRKTGSTIGRRQAF